MKIIRAIRTYSLKQSLLLHPYAYYSVGCSLFIVWANWTLWQRLQDMYPDWKKKSVKCKTDYISYKRQELADIRSYNNNVQGMRSDLKARHQ